MQEFSNYIAYLYSENVEEKMMTEAFLIFKDRFTTYLRDFIYPHSCLLFKYFY
ncbi:DUF2397 family protein [Bacillus sp. DX4.1]|uniref:DUF2397 family protein n=1 Tax=Bacillus sp. DX4.1 TaxID=3055867 RepID=UPI0025A01D0B|nr:DUF2397 family protein [Bacillus sp. DX4.1]MDM5188829.1 DUF2397 family protein [Bacillus sp. DX4.1]